MWVWIGELKPAQAAIVAAGLGFLTLAAGHAINSWLNRRRDKFLLDMERLNLLRAIMIEITQITNLIRNQQVQAKTMTSNQVSYSVINPSSLNVVYRNNLSNIHKLPPPTLMQIVPFYVALQEHEYNMVTHGAKSVGQPPSLQSFNLTAHHAARFTELNQNLEAACQRALSVCYPVVQHLEAKLEGRPSAAAA